MLCIPIYTLGITFTSCLWDAICLTFLGSSILQEDQKNETHFHIAVSCIAQSLKTQIINRSSDEVAICFFNTVSVALMVEYSGILFSWINKYWQVLVLRHILRVSSLYAFTFYLKILFSECFSLQSFFFGHWDLDCWILQYYTYLDVKLLSLIFFRLGSSIYYESLQREKRNLQDLNGVFVYNVAEREYLDRPTARLIKDFDCIEGKVFFVSNFF